MLRCKIFYFLVEWNNHYYGITFKALGPESSHNQIDFCCVGNGQSLRQSINCACLVCTNVNVWKQMLIRCSYVIWWPKYDEENSMRYVFFRCKIVLPLINCIIAPFACIQFKVPFFSPHDIHSHLSLYRNYCFQSLSSVKFELSGGLIDREDINRMTLISCSKDP